MGELEVAIMDRCSLIANDTRMVDALVAEYHDKYSSTTFNIEECNSIKLLILQPDHLRSIAVEQLTNEGIIPTH